MSEAFDERAATPAEAVVVTRVLRAVRSEKGGRLTLHFKTGRGAEAVTWERVESGRVDEEIVDRA